MTENKEKQYPNIAQSWGILGIAILSMIVFYPIDIILSDILGKEFSFFLYYLISLGVTFGIVHRIRYKRTGINKYNLGLSSMKIMVLVSITTVALIGITSPIVNLLPMPDFMKEIFLEYANQKGVFSFITLVLVAPVIEELIFRGVILNGFLRKYSPIKSIILSSVLFGVIHLNPWQFIGALLFGLFSGWLYYKTRKLTLSIIIHSVNNLIAFIGLYYTDTETMMDETLIESYGGYANFIFITIGSIIVFIISVLLLRKELNKLKINDSSTTLSI